MMSLSLIIRLLRYSFKTSSKIFASLGASEWIRTETGVNVVLFIMTVTLNQINDPLVVE